MLALIKETTNQTKSQQIKSKFAFFVSREKSFGAEKRTNKLNPHSIKTEIEHRWKASAFMTGHMKLV